jgi:TPR repeat protein
VPKSQQKKFVMSKRRRERDKSSKAVVVRDADFFRGGGTRALKMALECWNWKGAYRLAQATVEHCQPCYFAALLARCARYSAHEMASRSPGKPALELETDGGEKECQDDDDTFHHFHGEQQRSVVDDDDHSHNHDENEINLTRKRKRNQQDEEEEKEEKDNNNESNSDDDDDEIMIIIDGRMVGTAQELAELALLDEETRRDVSVAKSVLSYCFTFGRGVARSATKGVLCALELDEPLARTVLGYAYLDGLVVGKDVAKSLAMLTRVADEGHAHGQHTLAYIYEHGRHGVQKDEQRAFDLYFRAAEQGYAISVNNLGLYYEKGRVVQRDYLKALNLYSMAALKSSQRNALCNLGVCTEYGRGRAVSFAQALRLYLRAAERRLDDAEFNCGRIYAYAIGTERSLAEAIKWYRRAAERSYLRAAEELERAELFAKHWQTMEPLLYAIMASVALPPSVVVSPSNDEPRTPIAESSLESPPNSGDQLDVGGDLTSETPIGTMGSLLRLAVAKCSQCDVPSLRQIFRSGLRSELQQIAERIQVAALRNIAELLRVQREGARQRAYSETEIAILEMARQWIRFAAQVDLLDPYFEPLDRRTTAQSRFRVTAFRSFAHFFAQHPDIARYANSIDAYCESSLSSSLSSSSSSSSTKGSRDVRLAASTLTEMFALFNMLDIGPRSRGPARTLREHAEDVVIDFALPVDTMPEVICASIARRREYRAIHYSPLLP